MKLRNKKTGEIRELPDGFFCGDNLKKICEDWEDYEEPKGIQCIYYVNHFDAAKIDGVIVGFETKEEAEKAVEKLKAWKRLRDKGFRFNPNYSADGATINHKDVILCRFEAYYDDYGKEDNIEAGKDLDLIFGGEDV